jgi:uridine kinase
MQRDRLRNKKYPIDSLIAERNELMRGDTIIVEAHHRKAAEEIIPLILPELEASPGKYTITVAGESGSGKSETATAIAEALAEHDISSVIFQQDDYFVYPPKTNDATRRKDIAWVGTQEVRLDLLDEHLQAFRDGAESVTKPLVVYEDDAITVENMEIGQARVAIAEGTYTTALNVVDTHIFIDRSYAETRAHREKRNRDASELDSFTDGVLKIEHDIISAQKPRAKIVINTDYSVNVAD